MLTSAGEDFKYEREIFSIIFHRYLLRENTHPPVYRRTLYKTYGINFVVNAHGEEVQSDTNIARGLAWLSSPSPPSSATSSSSTATRTESTTRTRSISMLTRRMLGRDSQDLAQIILTTGRGGRLNLTILSREIYRTLLYLLYDSTLT